MTAQERRRNLLLVEDDPAHLELIRRAFDAYRDQFELVLAGSKQEASERLAESTPDLVISDLMLPDGRGTDLLLSGDRTKSFPLIIMTSQGNEQTAVKAIKSGGMDYIVKSPETFLDMPLTAERVLREWESLIELNRVQNALKTSETKYRSLYENSIDAIFLTRTNGAILAANPAACRMLNQTEEEIIRAGRAGVVDLTDPRVAELLKTRGETGMARGELTMVRKGGERFSVEISSTVFQDEEGNSLTSMIARDITDRKQMEDALRTSEFRYRELFEKNKDGVAIYEAVEDGQDFIFRGFNAAGEQIDDIHREQVMGKPVTEIFPGIREFGLLDVIERVWRTGKPEALPARYYKDDRIAGWRENYVYKLPDGSLVTLYEDVSDQKQAEEELLRRNRNLTALNEAAVVISQSHNQHQTFEAIIDMVLRITGMEFGWIALEKEPGKLMAEAACGFPDGIGMSGNTWEVGKGLLGMVAASGESVYVNDIYKDPRAIRLDEAAHLGLKSFCAVPIKAREQIFGVMCLAGGEKETGVDFDIQFLETIAHQLALSIENTGFIRQSAEMEALRELDKMRGELLSIVSHELRTPLAAIKGYASMMMDYEDRLSSQEKKQYVQSIDRSSDRLTELIDQLLDMCRLESGMLNIDLKFGAITGLLEAAATEARMRKPDYHIKLEIEEPLPPVRIDAMRIRQVVDNLIDNAIKYSRQGSHVTLSACNRGTDLLVSVADEGIGIPAGALSRVFERMYRASRAVDGVSIRGVGLGLSICKGLVEAHGGGIWMESEEGKGSTCYFTLPVT